MLGKPDHDIEAAIALKHPAGALAADRDFHQGLNVTDADPVARQSLTVQFGGEDGQSRGLLGFDIRGSSHLLQDRLDPRRGLDKHLQIVAE